MRRALSLLALVLSACSGNKPAQLNTPQPAPAPAVAEQPKPKPSVVRAAPREDNRGVIGGPRDDTAFEWDVADVDDVVEPELENVPPISRFVATHLAPYLETRRAKLATQAPAGRGIVVLTRLAETTHLHQVASPLGLREQLTFGREPVEQGAFSPGGLLTYRGDQLGTENFQIWNLNLETRDLYRLTDGESRNGGFRWLGDGSLAFTSNRRNGTDMDLYLLSAKALAKGESATLAAELPGQWVIQYASRDAKQLLLLEFLAVDQATLHLLDLETGRRRPVRELEPGVSTTLGMFGSKSRELYALSDRGGEFARVFKIDTESGVWTKVTGKYKWNVEEFALSGDGKQLAFTLNEDGYSMLYLQPLPKGDPRPAHSIPRGVISGLRFSDSRSLIFNLSTPTTPSDVFSFDLKSAKLTAWTKSEVGGLAKSSLVNPTLVTTQAPDGVDLPSLYYKPAGDGPFPVLLWMHGGPEQQSRPSFDPVIQYWVATRKVAVLAPNVRGSDGYGKTFLALDNGNLRHKAVEDVGTWLDWIAKRSELDATRVGIHGASYGGFMVLAALTKYGDRIRAGCDVVGASDLVTFLENTSEYRRDLRRREYGDESDVEMRDYLHSISPLHQASKIQSALLIAHGENDPRVPITEARQIAEAVRSSGHDTWFFLAKNEGHSFRRRRTRDLFYSVMSEFFERYLVQGLDSKLPPEPQLATEPEQPAEVEAPAPGAPP